MKTKIHKMMYIKMFSTVLIADKNWNLPKYSERIGKHIVYTLENYSPIKNDDLI